MEHIFVDHKVEGGVIILTRSTPSLEYGDKGSCNESIWAFGGDGLLTPAELKEGLQKAW
jgi:hypothetical protein